MYRENIFKFMKQGEKILFVPKNGGLCNYITDMLPEIGVDKDTKKQLEIVEARGEDIPFRVEDCNQEGILAYGLTGDDLFDEYQLKTQIQEVIPSNLVVLNTYDWFDNNAEFKRPAMCLMNKTGRLEDIPKQAKVAINAKYEYTSWNYLENPKFEGIKFKVKSYFGDTEKTLTQEKNDCCVEIVYSGKSRKEQGLEIADIVRFSDIVLIGEDPNLFGIAVMQDYQQVEERKNNPREESYTTELLADQKKIRDKVISEAAELFSAIEGNGDLIEEISDLVYAINAVIVGKDVDPRIIASILQKRLFRRDF